MRDSNSSGLPQALNACPESVMSLASAHSRSYGLTEPGSTGGTGVGSMGGAGATGGARKSDRSP